MLMLALIAQGGRTANQTALPHHGKNSFPLIAGVLAWKTRNQALLMFSKVMQRRFDVFPTKPGFRWSPLLHC
jgi:hypothetical protein